MKRYYVCFPGNTLFLGVGFYIYVRNEIEARQWVREWLKVKRVPNGFFCRLAT